MSSFSCAVSRTMSVDRLQETVRTGQALTASPGTLHWLPDCGLLRPLQEVLFFASLGIEFKLGIFSDMT